jgi:hypothetical protein
MPGIEMFVIFHFCGSRLGMNATYALEQKIPLQLFGK